jgi:uncharacterized protein YfbU (UPF0304 family)
MIYDAGTCMKLSNGEKLILVMLCEIYEHLGIKGEVDPKLIRAAMSGGHSCGLLDAYQGILTTEEDDSALVKETISILDMWALIETAHEKLSSEDKTRVERDAAPFGKEVKFPGFDANNERHYGVAHFLIKEIGRFPHFKARHLNSHWQALDGYRRMLAVFEPIRRSSSVKPLDADQIIKLLKARGQPADH